MVLDATERYARLLRSRHIVLIKPHPKLMQNYEAAGYNKKYVAAVTKYAAVKDVEAL
ncbi:MULTISPECIES: hypothetical protein [unclassified Caballeronia]|uniref:hypothetical protein n=1 Tax=unclassified Caballeronia TaxID=2646786 RepID=UPI002027C2F6|nr:MULTISPECIES: hypothetical protein [unclassified Caballeronia]